MTICRIPLLYVVLFATITALPTPLFTQQAIRQNKPHAPFKIQSAQHILKMTRQAKRYWNANPDSGLIIGHQALNAAKAAHLDSIIGKIHLALGVNYWAKSDYAQAQVHYMASKVWAVQNKDSLFLGRALHSLGMLYTSIGNYDEALLNSIEALALFKALKKPLRIANLYNNLGALYIMMRDTANAKFYYRAGLTLAETHNIDQLISSINYNIGLLLMDRGETDQARHHLMTTLRTARARQDKRYSANALISLGNIAIQQENFETAESNLLEAIALLQESGNIRLASAYLNLGRLMTRKGIPKAAEKALKMALEISQTQQHKGMQLECHQACLVFYKRQNAQTEIIAHLEAVNRLKDSLYSEQSAHRRAELTTQHELDLKQQRQELTAQSQHRLIIKQRIIIALSMLLLAIGAAAFWGLRKSKRETEHSRKALERMNTVKDRFFSIIAHDLRHPFQTLTSYVRLMEHHASTFSPNEILEMTHELRQGITATSGLLENLLKWAKSQTGTLPFNPKPQQLIHIYESVVTQITPMATSKSIQIISDIPADLTACVDNAMMESVLRNLIINAIKFTHQGGRITVRCTKTPKQLLLMVQDDGVGLSAGDLGNLFRLDVRTNKGGTAQERGSGLGLILCKEFVRQHGGRIWAESEPKNGARFYVQLPCKK